ncbi:uncharacterized protein MYCFIDRAFT_170126 [Pseudocercospora fijiensis CIRAD86]|uniref:Uncharacterized protein n=1 Tax=Pseudocercospora fijiensis (strain CIRAD86) TaxID=383855 RepID=N1Q7A8_PSEFD|nr:uncharacterized protein MYCFIDRAFT_170126 [Pseudocercospora fijiensis CIRAD86]EME88519.1 hypothetical protein MYCFIDRAFT_170126 [Pseudocercospora fijiensis CIRAD86]
MKLSNVGLTFSQHAIAAASQAAGVSFDYAQTALKFATLETAQGIGYLASSDTATAAIQKLKRRFPLLEDIQRAYSEGQDVQRSRRLGRDPRPMFYDDGEEEMMMADPESGAEMQIVYENSSAQEPGQSHGQFRGGPLDHSNPIIGSENDSEDLKAKEDAEATESKVDLWLKGVVEKEF